MKTEDNVVRAAIYARVSLGSQSTAPQISELQEYVARRGWLGRSYNDEGWSGAKASRPELDRMLSDIRKRKVDVVVVWSLDRLARSLKQLLALAEEFRELSVGLISYKQNLDSTTASGRLMFAMLGAIAEFERELLRERVRAGVAQARRNGKRLGRPPVRRLSQEEIQKLKSARRNGLSYRALSKQFAITVPMAFRLGKSVGFKPNHS